jgi:hypothetical protein
MIKKDKSLVTLTTDQINKIILASWEHTKETYAHLKPPNVDYDSNWFKKYSPYKTLWETSIVQFEPDEQILD